MEVKGASFKWWTDEEKKVEGFDEDYKQCEFCGRFFRDIEKHKDKVHGGKSQTKL